MSETLLQVVASAYQAECPVCGAPTKPLLMVAHIQAIVAAYYQIPVREMTSARRHKEVAHPRQIAMYLAYETTPKSLPDIGRRFGGRDHTTVIYAIRQIQKRMIEDAEIAEDIRRIREKLNGHAAAVELVA
jgi:chromosomal replication initiator protein